MQMLSFHSKANTAQCVLFLEASPWCCKSIHYGAPPQMASQHHCKRNVISVAILFHWIYSWALECCQQKLHVPCKHRVKAGLCRLINSFAKWHMKYHLHLQSQRFWVLSLRTPRKQPGSSFPLGCGWFSTRAEVCRWISEDAAAGQAAGSGTNARSSQCPLLPHACPLVLQGDGEF